MHLLAMASVPISFLRKTNLKPPTTSCNKNRHVLNYRIDPKKSNMHYVGYFLPVNNIVQLQSKKARMCCITMHIHFPPTYLLTVFCIVHVH